MTDLEGVWLWDTPYVKVGVTTASLFVSQLVPVYQRCDLHTGEPLPGAPELLGTYALSYTVMKAFTAAHNVDTLLSTPWSGTPLNHLSWFSPYRYPYFADGTKNPYFPPMCEHGRDRLAWRLNYMRNSFEGTKLKVTPPPGTGFDAKGAFRVWSPTGSTGSTIQEASAFNHWPGHNGTFNQWFLSTSYVLIHHPAYGIQAAFWPAIDELRERGEAALSEYKAGMDDTDYPDPPDEEPVDDDPDLAF